MNNSEVYLWGYHCIRGTWDKLQGPFDKETAAKYQVYFAKETLADAYRNVPFSGFTNDTRPVYSKFAIRKNRPRN